MATKCKYTAEGFLQDAEKLLKEFVDANSVDFPVFSAIWKKHYFSLIFMGRIDGTDASEFTNEIFRITMELLNSTVFTYQVGSVYLLYSLYLNQVLDPPIRIRTTQDTWKKLLSIRNEAISKNYRTLQYVIEYLIKNSLDFVVFDTLKGPLIVSRQENSGFSERLATLQNSLKVDILDYYASSSLRSIRDLQSKYLELKLNIDPNVKVSRAPRDEEYDKLLAQMDELVNLDRPVRRVKEAPTSDNIGVRRARLKEESFARHATYMYKPRFEVEEEDSVGEDELVIAEEEVKEAPKKKTKSRRLPQSERRVGRPRKRPIKEEVLSTEENGNSDDEIITKLISQQQDFYLPPGFLDIEKDTYRKKPRRMPLYNTEQ